MFILYMLAIIGGLTIIYGASQTIDWLFETYVGPYNTTPPDDWDWTDGYHAATNNGCDHLPSRKIPTANGKGWYRICVICRTNMLTLGEDN